MIEIKLREKLHILLAEDDTTNQLLIERWLCKVGYTVTIANNGKEALDYLNSESYDICIFDMQMPVMSGIEAVESYKNNHPKSKLPFIILTASIEPYVIEQCKKVGVDMYLAKPIESKTLIGTISNVCIDVDKPLIKEPVIDITQLDYYEDQEFMDKFIDIFEDSADKLVETLGNALEDNYDSFMAIVHSIKGLSGNIAANTLREITIKAEGLSKDDYNKSANEYYNKIVNELGKAKYELIKFSSNNKDSEK